MLNEWKKSKKKNLFAIFYLKGIIKLWKYLLNEWKNSKKNIFPIFYLNGIIKLWKYFLNEWKKIHKKKNNFSISQYFSITSQMNN